MEVERFTCLGFYVSDIYMNDFVRTNGTFHSFGEFFSLSFRVRSAPFIFLDVFLPSVYTTVKFVVSLGA